MIYGGAPRRRLSGLIVWGVATPLLTACGADISKYSCEASLGLVVECTRSLPCPSLGEISPSLLSS